MTILKLSGGEAFIEEIGQGRPIVVLHGGLGLDHSYLRPAFDRFAADYRVVYLDFLGNGRSDRTIDFANIRDNSIWVRQVQDVLAELELETPILVGHSYGGYIALELAIATGCDYPLLLVSTASSLKHGHLVDGNAAKRGTPEQLSAVRVGLAHPQPSDQAWQALWTTLLPLYFHAPTPELVAAAGGSVSYSAAGFNAAHLQVVPRYDVSGSLAAIKGPALVLAGDDDWILPVQQCSVPLFEGIERASLSVLPACGHFPFAERPELFHAVVSDWLQRLE